MKHYLQPALLAPPPQLPISSQEYSALESARRVLASAFAVEERYDLLVGNYLELEQELLEKAAASIVREDTEYRDFFVLRSEVNRRAINLLTAARLYIDQMPQHVSKCVPNGVDGHVQVREMLSKEYDNNFAYRFVEALRNHVQHRGIPVHSVTIGGTWTSLPKESGWLEHSVAAFTERRYLVDDGEFKKSVLAEMPETVDLLSTFKGYLQSLGAVQSSVRALMSSTVEAARATVSAGIEKYAAHSEGSVVGLAAHKLDDQGEKTSFPVLLDWDDVRIFLQRRNSGLVNLGKRIVSSKPSPQ